MTGQVAVESTDQISDASGASFQQYLTFILNDEEYGVDILKVQEIRGWEPVTTIPDVPEYLKGVVNLRGTIVPILDLRTRFSLSHLEYGPTTVVIVVRLQCDGGYRTVGLVVDAVSEVYTVSGKEKKPAAEFGASVGSQFVEGLATVDDKMIILLDVETLIEAGLLAHVASG